jgi:hypothetical protein
MNCRPLADRCLVAAPAAQRLPGFDILLAQHGTLQAGRRGLVGALDLPRDDRFRRYSDAFCSTRGDTDYGQIVPDPVSWGARGEPNARAIGIRLLGWRADLCRVSQTATIPAAFARKVSTRPPESFLEATLAFTHVTARPLAPMLPMVRRWAPEIWFPSALPSKLRGVWLLPRWDCLPLNTSAFSGRTLCVLLPGAHSSLARQRCTRPTANRATGARQGHPDSRSRWPAPSLCPPRNLVKHPQPALIATNPRHPPLSFLLTALPPH